MLNQKKEVKTKIENKSQKNAILAPPSGREAAGTVAAPVVASAPKESEDHLRIKKTNPILYPPLKVKGKDIMLLYKCGSLKNNCKFVADNPQRFLYHLNNAHKDKRSEIIFFPDNFLCTILIRSPFTASVSLLNRTHPERPFGVSEMRVLHGSGQNGRIVGRAHHHRPSALPLPVPVLRVSRLQTYLRFLAFGE